MNIAFLSLGSLRNPKESARITLVNLAKALTKQGHTVIIVTQRIQGLPEYEEYQGIPIYRPVKFPILSEIISFPWALRKIQQKINFPIDILHGFSSTPLFSISLVLSRWISARRSMTVLSLKSYSRRKRGNYGYWTAKRCDAVTVPTAIFYDDLKKKGISQLQVVHSVLDTEKFYPQNKTELREKYKYQNNKIILYYGALWEGKGIDTLIKALPAVGREIPATKLLILPRYKEIEPQAKLVHELGQTSNVQFITDDVAIEEYVNLADVVVLPYHNLLGTEGNPSCLLEAMACKTAVVTTNLPELKEIAEGLVYMAEPNKVDSLSQTIIEALNRNSSAMTEKAYEKSQEFSSAKIASYFLKVYQELRKKV